MARKEKFVELLAVHHFSNGIKDFKHQEIANFEYNFIIIGYKSSGVVENNFNIDKSELNFYYFI